MDERKLRILNAIIDDYIITAMPVGSRTLSKKLEIGGLSSATIRNEMSDLEELGFLDQPHTSAGRIPSLKAYRFYVDALLSGRTPLNAEDQSRIKVHFATRASQVEGILSAAADAISDVTQYTSLVSAPARAGMRIRNLQLVPVAAERALLVIVTDAGLVKDALLPIDSQLTMDHLNEISKMLTHELSGRTLPEARDQIMHIAKTLAEHRGVLMGVMQAVETANPVTIAVGGRANLLSHPEFADMEKARALLSMLDTREKLTKLMSEAPRMSFTIRVGEETGVKETGDSAVVMMSYRIGDETMGTLGVIGPTRMQYAKVLPVLDYMGKALSELLGR